MLRIVEILKWFGTIWIGQRLIIYTDHKTLTCNKFNTDRVLRWILILEEYGPDIEYIQVSTNIVADTLSIFTGNGIQETTHDST